MEPIHEYGEAATQDGRSTVIAISFTYLQKFTRLDKYWKDQDVMYDWTSEITGTGDRSEHILESTRIRIETLPASVTLHC